MFTPEQRRIFGPYFNGCEMVYADPILICRRLYHALDGAPNKYLEALHSEGTEEVYNATERVRAAAIEALEIKPVDKATGCGANEDEIFAALRSYLEWMQEKKEQGPISPTSSPPILDSAASAPAGFPPTIQLMYPYGATSGGCGCKKPGP